ncbi:MAG TPA: toll/interleukin-1 receptor domain-containing protein [Ktedonobacteraceae bacterium]|nr:toll/interleukin-1 receptor domain-containing protein [Ktedonobacteraceae bacterium]
MDPSVLPRTQVFIGYSDKDKNFLVALRPFLHFLENEGLIKLWSVDSIDSGANWKEETEQAIQKARVAILLISTYFMVSEIIINDILPPLLKVAETEGLSVIPVILRHCEFNNHKSLGLYKPVNSPSEPASIMKVAQREKLWLTVAADVRQAISKQRTLQSVKRPLEQTSEQPAPKIAPPVPNVKRQCFCPYCHGEIHPARCNIVATFPSFTRGEILYKADTFDTRTSKNVFEALFNRLPHYQCSLCHYILPPEVDEIPIKKIAIVGNPRSGLSTYITSLIQQISRQTILSSTESFVTVCVTPLVEQRYISDISRAQRGEELVRIPNLPAEDLANPLIYELTARPALDQLSKKTYLAMYEVTRDAFAAEPRIRQHVAKANALIYLVDGQTLQQRDGQVSSVPDQLASILPFEELFPAISSATPLAIPPMAITITKADLLKKRAQSDHPFTLSIAPPFSSQVDLVDLKNVQQDVLDLLTSHDHPLLAEMQGIAHKHFFAVSTSPEHSNTNGSSHAPEPCRSLDPLLWLLFRLGLLAEKSS